MIRRPDQFNGRRGVPPRRSRGQRTCTCAIHNQPRPIARSPCWGLRWVWREASNFLSRSLNSLIWGVQVMSRIASYTCSVLAAPQPQVALETKNSKQCAEIREPDSNSEKTSRVDRTIAETGSIAFRGCVTWLQVPREGTLGLAWVSGRRIQEKAEQLDRSPALIRPLASCCLHPLIHFRFTVCFFKCHSLPFQISRPSNSKWMRS